GFDMASIGLIVMYGVAPTMAEDLQRGGRGGRDGLECLVLTIAERWAYENLAETDADQTPNNKEERVERAVVEYASTKKCRRSFLALANNDNTPTACTYICRACCDNCTPDFDLSDFIPTFTMDSDSDSDSVPKKTQSRYRPMRDREPIVAALRSWTQTRHSCDPVLRTFPMSYILSETAIAQLAREKTNTFRIPRDTTDFLQEDPEWHTSHALDTAVLETIYGF
ncbi:hypothetical protein R3P38DRAFT_2518613, partial [Favolaschia claudopus]